MSGLSSVQIDVEDRRVMRYLQATSSFTCHFGDACERYRVLLPRTAVTARFKRLSSRTLGNMPDAVVTRCEQARTSSILRKLVASDVDINTAR